VENNFKLVTLRTTKGLKNREMTEHLAFPY